MQTSTAQSWSGGTSALSAALTMAVAVALLAYGGRALDQWWGTGPWFLLAGSLVGVAAGFLHLLRVLAPELLGIKPEPTSAENGPEQASAESGPGPTSAETGPGPRRGENPERKPPSSEPSSSDGRPG